MGVWRVADDAGSTVNTENEPRQSAGEPSRSSFDELRRQYRTGVLFDRGPDRLEMRVGPGLAWRREGTSVWRAWAAGGRSRVVVWRFLISPRSHLQCDAAKGEGVRVFANSRGVWQQS